MDSTTPKTLKQLGQFLQEQQEPFILEIYLSERGYRKNKLHSEGSINSHKGNSVSSLNRSGSFSLTNNKKRISIFSKVLRAVYKKLISTQDSRKLKNNDNRSGQFNVTEVARNIQEVAEPDRFSSASSTTVFNSCSESDVEETSTQVQENDISFSADTSQFFKLCSPGEKETAADRKLGRKCMEEDGKQISLVYGLEEIHSHRVSPLGRQDSSSTTQQENSSKSSTTLAKKITEDSLVSATLWSLLFESAEEKSSDAGSTELEQLIRLKSTSQFFKSKKDLQQTKQLLLDCMREALDIHGKERKQQQNQKEFMRPELLRKLLCYKIKFWGKLSGDEFDIKRLLNLDFQDSAQEWTDFQPQMKDLAFEIGDAILKEIRDQIVIDMVHLSKN